MITGNSPLTLTAGNTYKGGTTVSSGTLVAANDAALGPGPVLLNPAAGAAVLAFSTSTPSVGSLASNGAGTSLVVLGNASASSSTALTVGGNNASTTFSGTISDMSSTNGSAVGEVVKTGAGTWTLNPSGPNTYTGGTIVNQGTLVLDYANLSSNFGTIGGPLTINPGATVVVTVPKGIGHANATSGAVTTLTISGGLLNYTGSTSAGSPYGLGSGQTVFLTGGTIETNGGVSSPTAVSFYRFSNTVGPDNDYSVYTLPSPTPSVMSGGIELTSPATFNVAAGGALLVTAAIFNNANGGAPGSVTESGSGLMVFSGNNTYGGGTNINGGILQFAQTNSMPAAGTVTVASSAILAVNAGGSGEFTYDAASGTQGTISGLLAGIGGQGAPVSWQFGAILGIDSTNAVGGAVYSGSIADAGNGPLGLATLGSGTLKLTGSNTYTGGTDVLGNSTLVISSPDAIDANNVGTNLTVGSLSSLADFGTVFSPIVPASGAAAGAAVPEPSTWCLLAAGLISAVCLRRKKSRCTREGKMDLAAARGHLWHANRVGGGRGRPASELGRWRRARRGECRMPKLQCRIK